MTISLYNWIRGLSHPYPGAFTFLNDFKIYVWNAKYLKNNEYDGKIYNYNCIEPPGKILEVVAEGLIVATGDGAILLTELQKEGEKILKLSDSLKLKSIENGMIFQ